MKEYIIDGNEFDNYNSAYIYIKKILSENQEKEIITIGEISEKYLSGKDVKVVWVNSEKSKRDLGYKETALFYKRRLQSIPFHEIVNAVKKIKDAEESKGDTIFDQIISAICSSEIKVELK